MMQGYLAKAAVQGLMNIISDENLQFATCHCVSMSYSRSTACSAQDHAINPAGWQKLHAAAMHLLQAAVQIPESPCASTRFMSDMLLQSSYIAFVRLYLSRARLSAAAAQSCSLHASVLVAAVRSYAENVRARVIQLKILEFMVSDPLPPQLWTWSSPAVKGP